MDFVFRINFVRNHDVCILLLITVSPLEIKEWQVLNLSTLFIGVSRKMSINLEEAVKTPLGRRCYLNWLVENGKLQGPQHIFRRNFCNNKF